MAASIPELFILHAPEDSPVKKEIVKYLSEFERYGKVKITPDIAPDEDVMLYLRAAVERAHIILMLWTSDFLADNTLHSIGEYAAKLHLEKRHNVLPILVKQCLFELSENFSSLKKLPKNGKAMVEHEKPEEVMSQVADAICGILYLFQLENELEKANKTIIELTNKVAQLEKK